MSAALKLARLAGVVVLCLGSFMAANASDHAQHKAKKPALPPLPSGPTGPVPQMPLDSIAPVPPQVTYQNEQLTIVAPNSTLGDILRAVRKQTGAEIEIPEARERVVTRLGPGPAREVLAELLNGSRFNYVLLGSPQDASVLTRVVLVAKTSPAPNVDNQPMPGQQPMMSQAPNLPPGQEQAEDSAAEENADDSVAEQPAEEQPAAQPEQQPEIKTPQQMLQEMQQRQSQLQQQLQQQQQQQQQQPPAQAPVQGQGVVVRPPQQQ